MFGRETVATLRAAAAEVPAVADDTREALLDVRHSMRKIAAAAIVLTLVAAAYVSWQIIGQD